MIGGLPTFAEGEGAGGGGMISTVIEARNDVPYGLVSVFGTAQL